MDDKDFDNNLKNIMNTPPAFPFDEELWDKLEERLDASESNDTAGGAMPLWWSTPLIIFALGGFITIGLFGILFNQTRTGNQAIERLEQDIHLLNQKINQKDTVFIKETIYRTDTIYKTIYQRGNSTISSKNTATSPNFTGATFVNLGSTEYINQSFQERFGKTQQGYTGVNTGSSQGNYSPINTSFLNSYQQYTTGSTTPLSSGNMGFFNPFTSSNNSNNASSIGTNQGSDNENDKLLTIKDIPAKDMFFLDPIPAHLLATTQGDLSIDSMGLLVSSKKKNLNPLLHLQPMGFQLGTSAAYARPFGFINNGGSGLLTGVYGELLFGQHLSMTFGGEYLMLKYELKNEDDWVDYPIIESDNPDDVLSELHVELSYIQIPFGMKYRTQIAKNISTHIGLDMVARRSLKENIEYEYDDGDDDTKFTNKFTPPPFQLNTIRTNLGASYSINQWQIRLDALMDYDVKTNEGILPKLNYWGIKTGVFYEF